MRSSASVAMRGHIALQLRKVTRVQHFVRKWGGATGHAFEFTAPLLRKSCRRAANILPDPGRRPPRAENGPRGTPTAKILGSPATKARTARNPSSPEVALARANCGQARRAIRHAAAPINRPPTAGRTRRTSFVQAEGFVKRGSGPVPFRCRASATRTQGCCRHAVKALRRWSAATSGAGLRAATSAAVNSASTGQSCSNSNTDAERGQIQYNHNKGKQIHSHDQSDCGVHYQNANQPKESGLLDPNENWVTELD